MDRKKRWYGLDADCLVLSGFALVALFWLLDVVIDTALFRDGSFSQRLFSLESGETRLHLMFFFLQIGLIVYAWRTVSKRRRLQDALEFARLRTAEEKERSLAILEALGDAISIQDTDLKIVYQNAAHKDLMGEHTGEYCYRAYQQRESVCEGCHLVMSFTDGRSHLRENRALTAKGLKHVEILSTPLRDAGGMIVAGIEAIRDITDRRTMAERLEMHLAAMEAAMDGIAILTPEGEYIYLNRAHCMVYGYDSADELVGRSWRALYEEEELARIEPQLMAALRDRGEWLGEATGKRRDGSTFPQEVSLTVMDGGGTVCIVRDISDRKRVEAEIRQLNVDLERRAAELWRANKELEAFSYSVSHDLRTPLTRIYSAGQALQEGYAASLNESGRFFVRTICEASEQMEELIDALLELSRVTSSEMMSEEVDLSGLAREIASELHLTQPDREAEFVIAPGVKVNGDEQLLRIVLENLLGNAWKYTQKVAKARIEFGSAEHDGERCYFVRDNGAGFAMEDADRLFKPFHRLHDARAFPGTGIGLATVQRIIHRHGGRVWGEGEVSRGATFYFTLK